jgi:hypothetical protein
MQLGVRTCESSDQILDGVYDNNNYQGSQILLAIIILPISDTYRIIIRE